MPKFYICAAVFAIGLALTGCVSQNDYKGDAEKAPLLPSVTVHPTPSIIPTPLWPLPVTPTTTPLITATPYKTQQASECPSFYPLSLGASWEYRIETREPMQARLVRDVVERSERTRYVIMQSAYRAPDQHWYDASAFVEEVMRCEKGAIYLEEVYFWIVGGSVLRRGEGVYLPSDLQQGKSWSYTLLGDKSYFRYDCVAQSENAESLVVECSRTESRDDTLDKDAQKLLPSLYYLHLKREVGPTEIYIIREADGFRLKASYTLMQFSPSR